MSKLQEFLQGRPYNRGINVEDATIQYIEELERLNNEYYNRKGSGMSFGRALQKVKHGAGMRLPQWAPDVVVRAQFPDEYSKMTAPYLYVESRFGRVPWKETNIELFSEDWEVVE